MGFYPRFYLIGQLATYKANKILESQGQDLSLFTFESLKSTSYIINITQTKALNLPPPIKDPA